MERVAGTSSSSNAFQVPLGHGLETSPATSSEQRRLRLQCGPIQCQLPRVADHDDYLDFFFTHINPFHPCLNVNDVRKSSGIVYERAFGPNGRNENPVLSFQYASYLALMMSIYACVDLFRGTGGVDEYLWYRQSQELVGRRQVTAVGEDLTGIQILILQVSRQTL